MNEIFEKLVETAKFPDNNFLEFSIGMLFQ